MSWYYKHASKIVIVLALAVIGLVFWQITAGASEEDHVTICHRTGSVDGGNQHNGYSLISPSASGVVHGHLGHDFQVGNGPESDVIPEFPYDGETYGPLGDQSRLTTGDCSLPKPDPWVATAAVQQGSPCGDPFYGFVLNSNYDALFTIRYRHPISHGVYEWTTKDVSVTGKIEWSSGSLKENFIHVKAGTVITIVATYGEDSHGFTFDAVKSGRTDCPWNTEG